MIRLFPILLLLAAACSPAQTQEMRPTADPAVPRSAQKVEKIKNPGRVVHVLVALCDNENQGIVPVPAHLGNGEDPVRNLYWGAAFGVKTYFSRSKNWELIDTIAKPSDDVLERLVFKHRTANVYLVADAYRGSRMRKTIDDFFDSASGAVRENVKVGDALIQIRAGSDLVAFVGHDGLMDFKLDREIERADEDKRDAVVLACASRNYFFEPMKKSGANPLLWTSNLMAPEAYILHDALEGWIRNESGEQVRERAALAYAKYQKISLKAAKNILVSGF